MEDRRNFVPFMKRRIRNPVYYSGAVHNLYGNTGCEVIKGGIKLESFYFLK